MGGAVLWDFGSCSLGNLCLWGAPCRAEEPSLPRWQWQCVQARPHKDQCWVLQALSDTGNVLSWCVLQAHINSPSVRGSSRSCDPDEFTRELSRVFSFPVCSSYTFAHPNPVLCTMMQTLIINQIIQPAFSNSCLIQFSFILVIWCLLPYFIYCI